MPVFLSIGNHEVIPPKTRDEFVLAFADWLNGPAVREQRISDEARAASPKGTPFISSFKK